MKRNGILAMMKYSITLVVLLLASVSTKAQETFATTGGDATGTSSSISYTVGQMSIMTGYERVTAVENASANVREGVQQTYSVEELKIDGAEPFSFDVKVYPNPTTDNITIRLEQSVTGMRYELYGANGQLLQKESIDSNEQTIDMGEYAAGAYLLRIMGDTASQSYRIIKGK